MTLQFITLPMMMLAICLVNLAWNHRKCENKLSLESARLQAALLEELYLLKRLYRSNLGLLDQPEARILSTRMPMAIFRANLGRLTLLEESTIRRLVAVHANNEHIEMMIAQRAKSIKNGQCTVYLFEKEDVMVPDFKTLFTDGIVQVERTIAMLDVSLDRAHDERPQPHPFTIVGKVLGFSER